MAKRKINYKEGSSFFIPLRTNGFARGLVARCDGKGGIFAYFFGPKLEQPGSEFGKVVPSEAILLGMCGDLGLLDETWPRCGVLADWERSDWPLPPLFREDKDAGKAWLTYYNEDTLGYIREERVSPELRTEYPEDVVMGYGSAEIAVTQILDGAEFERALRLKKDEEPVPTNENRRPTPGKGSASLRSNRSRAPTATPPLALASTVTNLEDAVVALLEELQRISQEHEEVTDTDVQESISLALNSYFVWGRERTPFPRSFGMFSAKGDRLVAAAVLGFLEAAETSGELANIPVGQARLDVLQADSAVTEDGATFDDFIGYLEAPLPAEPLPEHMFEEREYDEGE